MIEIIENKKKKRKSASKVVKRRFSSSIVVKWSKIRISFINSFIWWLCLQLKSKVSNDQFCRRCARVYFLIKTCTKSISFARIFLINGYNLRSFCCQTFEIIETILEQKKTILHFIEHLMDGIWLVKSLSSDIATLFFFRFYFALRILLVCVISADRVKFHS